MRTSPRRSLLALLAILAAAALPGAVRPARAGGGGAVAAVPDVVGRSRADASAVLAAEGYLVGIYEIAGDPPDTVAAQSPAGNTALPRGGVVCLDVRRKESDKTPSPKAVGLTTAEATAAFGRLYDLRYEGVPGGSTQAGRVLSQLPAEGQPLALRGSLVLRYALDPSQSPTVGVPVVAGFTAAQAIEALGNAGLNAQIVEAAVPGAPADLAIGQQPLPGSEVARGSAVRVVVTIETPGGDTPALGTSPVPNVTGMSESAAIAALEEAGFDTVIEHVPGAPSDAFLVVDQAPAATTEAAPGSAVTIKVVEHGPHGGPTTGSVSIPDLVGLSSWQAEDLLVSIGLRANPLLVENPSVPGLRVFAQQLAVGSVVPTGTSVTYRVARPAPPPSATAIVPNFYGRSVAATISLAATAGVTVTIVEIATNAHPAWRVFSQSIAAYSIVPPGTTVIARVARPSGGGTTVIVPDLTGKTAAQAAALLAASSLAWNGIEVLAPGKPPLKVFDQFPNHGAQVPAGTVVQGKIAKLSIGWKSVPALVGLTKAQAVAAVLAAGLQPDADDVVTMAHPAGKVFQQALAPNTLRPAGSIVSFRVAKSALVLVPVLSGKTMGQANAALAAAGLVPNGQVVFAPAHPAGKVFDQNPNGGALVGNGTVVMFRVAQGALPPAMVMVPDLDGKTKAQAIALLASRGLGHDADEVFAPGKPFGLVFAQSPGAGLGVPAGTVVQFKISKSLLLMVQVPNLIGLTANQAKNALLAVGLNSNGLIQVNLGKPLHKVYSQGTAPFLMVPKGTTITWRANP